MPYVNKPRPYKKEYDEYHGTEKQKKLRAKRNAARNAMNKKGLVKKGDGKDVDHLDHNPNNNSASNLKVKTASKNRSFKRKSNHKAA
tara:strand:+ start:171 stop:431 length:261 start_codon:yes stop_codon:yes gene_type:complete